MVAALAVCGALPAFAARDAMARCVAPNTVGVSLAQARRVLRRSGCRIELRQLPGHGRFVAPTMADARQLVARQSPAPGASSRTVTLWLSPLCVQSALPPPGLIGPVAVAGPTRLVTGLFLVGGPLRRAPSCAAARPSAGTLTVSAARGTRTVATRTVRQGRYAIFPLRPGSYVLTGAFGDATANGRPIRVGPVAVTVYARRTTRRNLTFSIR